MSRASPGTHPTPEGNAYLLLVTVFVWAAYFLHDNLVLLLVVLELGCGLAAWPLARRNVRRVRVVRRIGRRARTGIPLPVEYEVENRSRGTSVGIVVRDAPDPGARPQAIEIAFGSIAARSKASAVTSVTFDRRGLRRLRSPTCSSRFPLGLFQASAGVDAADDVLVRPREGRATDALRARLVGESPAAARTSLALQGMDRFHGLREFREGDDPRRIHWRTTARRGVRTFLEWRAEAGRRVVVVLGRGETASPDADRRFERAVSVAATVVRACSRDRLPVRLCLGDDRRDPAAGISVAGGAGLDAALDALALVRSHGGRRPRAALDAVAGGRAAKTIVWIGSADEPEIPERLSRAAGRRGDFLHLRTNDAALARFVTGLP